MRNTQEQLIHSRIWELLSDYADIRDELEDASLSIRFLYEELESALKDVGEELADIEAHISTVSGSLRRFRCSDTPDNIIFKQDIEEKVPWN